MRNVNISEMMRTGAENALDGRLWILIFASNGNITKNNTGGLDLLLMVTNLKLNFSETVMFKFNIFLLYADFNQNLKINADSSVILNN